MKERLKNIYYWIIDFFHTIVSIFLIIVFNRFGVARKLRKCRDDRAGKAATILANGPSVCEIINKKNDLLDGTDVLVLNYFGNQDVFFKLKPRYYVLIDPAFFDYNYTNNGLEEKGNKQGHVAIEQLINNLKKVNWPLTLFFPDSSNARKAKTKYSKNKNIEIVLFNGTRVVGFRSFQNWMYKLGKGIPSSRNVIIPSMILLIILGYKKIYLYGCELSWTKTMDVDPENGQMFFNDRHFYSKDEIRYFGKGAYLWWLESISEMLRGIVQVAKFAKEYNVKIVNRTKGSFIDSFEYENPDTISL